MYKQIQYPFLQTISLNLIFCLGQLYFSSVWNSRLLSVFLECVQTNVSDDLLYQTHIMVMNFCVIQGTVLHDELYERSIQQIICHKRHQAKNLELLIKTFELVHTDQRCQAFQSYGCGLGCKGSTGHNKTKKSK